MKSFVSHAKNDDALYKDAENLAEVLIAFVEEIVNEGPTALQARILKMRTMYPFADTD
ncbi:MAG: hypothetical protein AAGI90_01915 [Chlamydiota bacterium]